MARQLAIEIPESVTTYFVVATQHKSTFSTGYVRDLLSTRRDMDTGSLGEVARDLLKSPLLVVKGEPTVMSDWTDRLREVAGPDEELGFLLGAPGHIVVASITPPAAQPQHAQAARLVARVLAAETAGVVVDMSANQALCRGGPPRTESESFVLGDDWLAVFVSCDDAAAAPGRVRVETAGLRRFALPELTMRSVPLGRMVTAVNMLRALAVRLLAEHWAWLSDHPGELMRWISGEQYVAGSDVWRYWGARYAGGDGTVGGAGANGVWVRLVPWTCTPSDGSTALEITPHGDRRNDDWWDNEAGRAIPLLTSAPWKRKSAG